MTRTYQTDRIVVDHKETHMTAQELADLCHVQGRVIRKACQEGKVRAFRAGRLWLIPRLDGQLFAAAYLKANSGVTWEPKVAHADRGHFNNNPQRTQKLQFELEPEMLRAIDCYRLTIRDTTGRKIGRTEVLRQALTQFLGGES